MKLLKVLFVLSLLIFSGCSLIEKIKDQFDDDDKPPVVEPTPSPTPSTPPDNTPETHYFADGSGGNLWKPVSDTTGNVVVLFSSKWKKEFSGGCKLDRKDGKVETLYCGGAFACFGNPDPGGPRLHMRSNIKCNQAKSVKVTCKEGDKVLTFTLKDSVKLSKVCDRHD